MRHTPKTGLGGSPPEAVTPAQGPGDRQPGEARATARGQGGGKPPYPRQGGGKPRPYPRRAARATTR
jgi:hypothetical protein